MVAQFRLLGSVEIANGRHAFPLPATKPSVVLAALLLHANEFLGNDRLTEIVWGDANPRNPRSSLQTYVMRLRQTLAANGTPGSSILTLPGGYSLEATPETLDLLRFRQLVERARRGGDPREESRRLNEALALRRGPMLANIPSDVLLREEVPKLEEEWLAARERRIDIDLALGRHRDLVAELRGLTATYPQRERFWEQLMEALYRSGRQSEALAAYHEIKSILLEQLGVDPGSGLQRMELAILKGEIQVTEFADDPPGRPAPHILGPHTAGPSALGPLGPGPQALGPHCRLPPQPPGFVGRGKIAGRIADELAKGAGDGTAVVTAIRGEPGAGKSALALSVAYDVAGLFPDGQWYLRLSTEAGRPRPPVELLGELLGIAGLRPTDLGEDQAEREAAYRAMVRDRRVLLLLDDAQDARQVEPLLPGSPGSAVLVTSRTSLGELTARWRVRSYEIGPLPTESSLELLAGMLGRERVERERAAAVALTEICDGLPLALRIAAARFAGRPGQDLGDFVAWLAADPLARLAVGRRPRISVRRAFEVSCERLGPDARRLLSALAETRARSVFGADDIADRTGTSLPDTEEALEELFDAGLLRGHGLDRFAMPTLLHTYTRLLQDRPTPLA
ncbi:AfsR/SARP family transcriptional regulator [Actinomadura spongiicola]|uniref:AfsR/SARP family transcriptional regulator n=1 Tax=Actinomadura spongiicola TaxID=2303421 RepID=UPI0013143176|nr:AfsR/SARP family transcriptional regulator [Actinomadura spongiicola]